MGILYIIATPIGNLQDITLRALEALKDVDLIVCEDTRRTIKLLNHYNIAKPLVSYFQHSKLQKVKFIFEQLKRGKKIALVADAGTPGISDPGNRLIEYIVNQKEKDKRIKIIPIPGVSAVTAALSISGFPADKFIFMGFPPHKKNRERFFKEIVEAKYTIVFYESVYRIIKTLEKLRKLPSLRERGIVVCRELTKQFETIYRGKIDEVLEKMKNDKIKGEYVVVLKRKVR